MITIQLKEPKDGLGGSAQLKLPTGIEADMLTGAVTDGVRIIDNLDVLSRELTEFLETHINVLAEAEGTFADRSGVVIQYKLTGKEELALLQELLSWKKRYI